MEQNLAKRFMFFNAWSTFSCEDSCKCHGCKEPDLHIPLSLVDLVAVSLISGCKAKDLFKQNVKIGFDPLQENEPWIGRVALELKKPCHFLDEGRCSIYAGRPMTCALFPEYYFIMEHPERVLKKEIFQKFPCIQKPCSISLQRRATLRQLWEMFSQEVFLSDFYLFGISPLIIDLKNMAGEGLEGIPFSENGKATLPHLRIERLVSQRLEQGGYLNDWAAKIENLDRADGLEELAKIKSWADQMAIASGGHPLNIVYQFNGNQLHPIHFHK